MEFKKKVMVALISAVMMYAPISMSEVMISGIPLGGKFEPVGQVHTTAWEPFGPGWTYNIMLKKGFFDSAEWFAAPDSTVEVISFEKVYPINVLNLKTVADLVKADLYDLKSSLELKYGLFDVNQAERLLGEESSNNLFWMGAIDQHFVIANPVDGIGKIQISLGLNELEMERLELGRKVRLSLLYYSPRFVELATQVEKQKFADY